jgi:hypothetical protein
VTDVILPLAALSACIWILYHHLQTGSERLGLATMAAHGPDDWDRAWRQTGHLRHLLARLTCRDWRRLYPARLVHALVLLERNRDAAHAFASIEKHAADRWRDADWTAAARRALKTGEAAE